MVTPSRVEYAVLARQTSRLLLPSSVLKLQCWRHIPKLASKVLRAPAVQALGGAALAHTGLSFVPSSPASSSFFRFDVLV